MKPSYVCMCAGLRIAKLYREHAKSIVRVCTLLYACLFNKYIRLYHCYNYFLPTFVQISTSVLIPLWMIAMTTLSVSIPLVVTTVHVIQGTLVMVSIAQVRHKVNCVVIWYIHNQLKTKIWYIKNKDIKEKRFFLNGLSSTNGSLIATGG